jgi:hypothetical protein
MLHKVQVEQPLARLFFLSVSVDSNIRYVSVKVKEKMQMCKQRHRTAWGTGIKPKMDAKRTWYMFKDDLSKTTEILIKKKQRFLLPILTKEKY